MKAGSGAFFIERLSEIYETIGKRNSCYQTLDDCQAIVKDILATTLCHPYYTQQLASQVWELLYYEHIEDGVVEMAVERLVNIHDLDFERLWQNFNRTDKQILFSLSSGQAPLQNRQVATSTLFSSIKKLMKVGFVIRMDSYEIEDPFLKRWIKIKQG